MTMKYEKITLTVAIPTYGTSKADAAGITALDVIVPLLEKAGDGLVLIDHDSEDIKLVEADNLETLVSGVLRDNHD